MTDSKNNENDSESTEPDRLSEQHPKHIGAYRILDVLGEGGMAVVYLAEQSEPVKRRVALKIVKLGMDSKQVVARFESERQALAVLDHPNIAKIFDGGITDSGRPYFVMEQVQGIPITDYCDNYRLSTTERVELFATVCSAVQHAHHKGLIHRDLKPSNLLVGVVGGNPQVKIIDFGIAKATGTSFNEQTLVTKIGQIIGTPQYMSPEQADITGLDVDTRTDIYSLGVVLYELLVGVVPLDLTAIGERAIRHALREKDPPKPSTGIADLGDTKEEIAKARNTDPDNLRRQLRGDLDWVVMRAIAKDRTRRYETANAFAMECRRFLNSEPVLARPPSTGYVLRRLIKRNQATSIAVCVALLAILAGAIAATVGMMRAQEAENAAEMEADATKAINEFLQQTMGAASPWSGGLGRDVTILEALDAAVARIDESFGDQPLIAAELRDTIGRTYLRLAQYDKADPLLQSSLEVRRALLGDEHQDVAESFRRLGELRREQGMTGEADKLIGRAVDSYRKLFDEGHPNVVDALAAHALVMSRQARYDEAVNVAREVLRHRREFYGDEHPQVALALNDLGWFHILDGQWDESEMLLRETEQIYSTILKNARPQEKAAIQNLMTLSLSNLGTALRLQGKLAEAERIYRRTLETNRRLLGDVHPRIVDNLLGLAAVLGDRGEDFDEALRLTREAVELQRQVQGDNSAEYAGDLQYLATVLNQKGDYDEALVVNREAVEIYRQLDAEGNGLPDWYASVLNNTGLTLMNKAEYEEALPYLQESIDVYDTLSGGDPANAANARSNHGACLTELGRYQEAEDALRAAFPVLQAERGNEHTWTARTKDRLFALYGAWGKADKAAEYKR